MKILEERDFQTFRNEAVKLHSGIQGLAEDRTPATANYISQDLQSHFLAFLQQELHMKFADPWAVFLLVTPCLVVLVESGLLVMETSGCWGLSICQDVSMETDN